MEEIVFLFPGQGSQSVGMCKDILDNYPEITNNYFTQASEVVGFDLQELCFTGPEDKLNNTKFTQPAIFTVSYILTQILKQHDIEPAAACGHSLGEYTALCAAGVYSFSDGVLLVKNRGQLMAEAVPEGQGSMAAVIGLGQDQVSQICQQVSGILEIANLNSPGQIIISGEMAAIKKGMELAEEKGAKKVIELNVSGPFHSSLMAPVQEKLKKVLDKIELSSPRIPVVGNASAAYLESVSDIRTELLAQLTQSVRWIESMELFIEEGYEKYIEPGPGRVLRGLMRRIDRSAQVFSLTKPGQLDKICEKLN
ncbi:MAG: ACP S-malonyltransferase [Halanaerobiaceae bacterium]